MNLLPVFAVVAAAVGFGILSKINARQNQEIVVAESRRFNYGDFPAATTQQTPGSGFQVESKTPLRVSRVESEVIVPLLITLISAVIVALGLGIAAWRYAWSADVPLWGFVGVLGLVWAWRLLRSDRLMWQLERMTGHDIDGDGQTGKPGITLLDPAVARQRAQSETLTQRQESAQAELIAFVGRCVASGTSESDLGIKPGRRGDYVECRDALLTLGIATWNDPNRRAAGWSLAVSSDVAAQIIEDHVI